MPESHLILIVDDEPMLLDLIHTFLKGQGYQAIACSSGKEALEVLEHEKITAVISDLNMPEINGLAVLDQFKKMTPNGVSILYTGTGKTGVADHPSVDVFLSKPFELNQLQGLLQQVL